MFKKILIAISLLATSIVANAGFIEQDWQTVGDHKLTLVTDLNLEILDVSLTSGGHAAVMDELGDGGLFSGFRFMNRSELFSILNPIFDGELNIRNASGILSTSESASVSEFLALIDGTDYTMFNTCDNPLGCDFYSGGYALINGNRHIIAPNFVYYLDDVDAVGAQFLVRNYSVPEPTSLLLLAIGILGLWPLRRFKV
jgi:hypothetical protein